MNDIVALQYAFYRGLRSCSLFHDFNIVLGREFLFADEVDMASLWQTPGPTGKQGLGLIVFVPDLVFPKPNSLQREREFSVGIFEERNLNLTPGTGTMVSADDVGDMVIDFMWNWRLWRSSGVVPASRALVEDRRFDGIYGRRAVGIIRQERSAPPRAAVPAIAVDGARFVTLSVPDGSAIYYTTDGFSYPGPATDGKLPGEQAATLYTAPFQVAANTTVLAAAFASGTNPSQTTALLIT
jgi:Fn3 associated